jgi:hypothetical protein
MTATRKHLVLGIAFTLVGGLVWQIRETLMSGSRLHLNPVDARIVLERWLPSAVCDPILAVANNEGDTLLLCRSSTTERITARWQLSLSAIQEIIVSDTPFRSPQNITIHEYTVGSVPPTKYFSIIPTTQSPRKLYIHFADGSSSDFDIQRKWRFRCNEVQFSMDGSTVAYAFRFTKERSGVLSLAQKENSALAALELDLL